MTMDHYQTLKAAKWTTQLYAEYEALVWQYKLPLKPVVIEVKELKATLGLWDSLSRQITISLNLIESYTWDVVVEVLKHEMAHQYVHEVDRSTELHGPLFRRACERLGVAEWAVRASGNPEAPIKPWVRREPNDEEERLLQRVQKLLALAGSANEHESLAAMRKVQELYQRYNIEHMAGRDRQDFSTLIIDFKKKRIERPLAAIASLLVEHYFVQVIYSSRYSAKDFATFKTIEIIGRPHNVEMAEYVLNYLRTQIKRLWKDYQKETGAQTRQKNSYMIGVLKGFREKLGKNTRANLMKSYQSHADRSRMTSLVKVEDHALETYVRSRFPRLHSRTVRSNSYDGGSYEAGFAEGQKLNMSQPIRSGESGGGSPKLLGP